MSDNILQRINAHEDADPNFVHRFLGWLVGADPEFVTSQLDRFEAFEAKRRQQ